MSNEAFEKWWDSGVSKPVSVGYDCAKEAWQACEAYNQQRIQELEAHIEELRKALEYYADGLDMHVLASTPQQSQSEYIVNFGGTGTELRKSQECKHGVNDGYCKECYMEQTK